MRPLCHVLLNSGTNILCAARMQAMAPSGAESGLGCVWGGAGNGPGGEVLGLLAAAAVASVGGSGGRLGAGSLIAGPLGMHRQDVVLPRQSFS